MNIEDLCNLNQMLFNMKKINTIKRGDKLFVEQDRIYIDRPSPVRWLIRQLCEQNKTRTYDFILNIIVIVSNEIKKFIECTPHHYYKRSGVIFLIRSPCEFNQLQIEILDMKRSIEVLKETYEHDHLFTEKMNTLINNIEDITPYIHVKWNYTHKCSLYTIHEDVNEDCEDCFVNIPLELSF
jgi:hypothetical protein